MESPKPLSCLMILLISVWTFLWKSPRLCFKLISPLPEVARSSKREALLSTGHGAASWFGYHSLDRFHAELLDFSCLRVQEAAGRWSTLGAAQRGVSATEMSQGFSSTSEDKPPSNPMTQPQFEVYQTDHWTDPSPPPPPRVPWHLWPPSFSSALSWRHPAGDPSAPRAALPSRRARTAACGAGGDTCGEC